MDSIKRKIKDDRCAYHVQSKPIKFVSGVKITSEKQIPEYMRSNKIYNYSSKLPKEEVETYTTRWETIKEYGAGILFMVVGIGIVWFLLASGIA